LRPREINGKGYRMKLGGKKKTAGKKGDSRLEVLKDERGR